MRCILRAVNASTCGWNYAPDPARELTILPDPLAGFGEEMSGEGRGGKMLGKVKRKWERRKGEGEVNPKQKFWLRPWAGGSFNEDINHSLLPRFNDNPFTVRDEDAFHFLTHDPSSNWPITHNPPVLPWSTINITKFTLLIGPSINSSVMVLYLLNFWPLGYIWPQNQSTGYITQATFLSILGFLYHISQSSRRQGKEQTNRQCTNVHRGDGTLQ